MTRRCFLAISPDAASRSVGNALTKAIQEAGFRVVSDISSDRRVPEDAIAMVDCVVADITSSFPSVLINLGIARALGKPCIIVVAANERNLALNIGTHTLDTFYFYDNTDTGLQALEASVRRALREYRRFPRRFRLTMGGRPSRSLFVVDWEKLSPSDFENLCFELLLQLGFRHVEWEKTSRAFDIVAELPKKDPDGYDYRELWFISTGRNAPPEVLHRMFMEPDVLRRVGLTEKATALIGGEQQVIPITLLLMTMNDMSKLALSPLDRQKQLFSPATARVRMWDRSYLTKLVYQFSQIGFKYFSDEGRSQSKYRKTPEELYEENVELTHRLSATVALLEDEKTKRLRAEREAVWKEISFTAAHKMGNPLFAIETNLDPLETRIEQSRRDEALAVVKSIRISMEKAKGIIDQFKSLTSAEQVRLVPLRLKPLLTNICSTAIAQGVNCRVECPDELVVMADPERLEECFDELVSNALHWFDKELREISIKAGAVPIGTVPGLDFSRNYALIRFSDNGIGIPIESKIKVFDAFFTTYTHGTGLGLAFVRRAIEGQGGAISEVGTPGDGAIFEIYLPRIDSLPETKPTL